MQAVLVREGGALNVESVPDPEPRPDDVVVQLRAAAVNRRDLLVRNPPGPAYRFPLPVIPGSDGAGIRRDTGEEVVIYPGLGWGDREDAAGPDWRILGGPDNGTYAELVKVPRANVFPKPQRLSWDEAAAFPLVGLAAYRALFSVGGLRDDETVLVLGAGGGVSTLAVPLAAQTGARVFDVRGARQGASRERVPEASTTVVGGGRCVPARRAGRLPRAVQRRRAARRRDLARPGRRWGGLDLGGAACRPGRRACVRDLVEGGEDRPRP